MPANINTFAVSSDTWAGSVTATVSGVGSCSATASSHSSPYRIASDLKAAADGVSGIELNWTVTEDGKIKLYSASTAFSLSFTGNVALRLGFSSSSYTAALSRTAESTSRGSFTPYTEEGLFFALIDVPMTAKKGIKCPDGALWLHCPATDHRYPILRLSVLRANSIRFRKAWSFLSTPAQIDIPDTSQSSESPAVVTLQVGRLQARETSKLSGFAEYTIEVVR